MYTHTITALSCPNATTLRQFLCDDLDGAGVDSVKQHIDSCSGCQQTLQRLVGGLPEAFDAIAPLGDTPSSAQETLPSTEPRVTSPIEVPGYELLGELGRGGMGIVYKARQLRPDRIVALKIMLAGRHAGANERTRFLHEAEAVAQLQHPYIVPLYEAGQHGDLLYLTLEYVSGGSLADLLQKSPLPPRDAARLMEQLSHGMHYSHGRGIVHRDLKPANILLSGEEGGARDETSFSPFVPGSSPLVPRITDFGLAKNVTSSNGLTASNVVCGTPSYMAPERALGTTSRVSVAADVYAIGAILYECLTGRPPFHGPTPTDTLLQVVADEPVPPSRLQPSMPRDLETICLKCLRKEPQQRYASALELAEDLRRFQAGEPICARPVGRPERVVKWCRRRPAVAALLAVVVLLTLVAGSLVTWQWRRTAAALVELQSEKLARAQRQVAALPDAAPARVPAILDELEANRAEVLPLIRQRYEQETEQPRRMRLALALLPVEPELLCQPLTDWMLSAEDPAEVLLVRDALRPYRATLAPDLWAKAEDAQTPATVRFRAWAALAAFDPDNPRWPTAGPHVEEHLRWANPLHRSLWTEAFRQLGQTVLLAPQKQASYYPLKLGMKWHYRKETSLGDRTQHIQQIVKIEKIDGQSLARLEAIQHGAVVASEHLSTTAKGIFRHRHNGLEISPPLCLLKFPVKTGESWESEYRFGDEKAKLTCRVGHEDVEVPAGKYQTVTAHLDVVEVDGSKTSITYWFAVGVGIVKLTMLLPPPPSPGPLLAVAANTVGLLGSPLGNGPVLAASLLVPGRATSISLELEKFEEGK